MKTKTQTFSKFLGSFSGLYYPYRMAVFWLFTKSLLSRLLFGPGSDLVRKNPIERAPPDEE